MPLMKRRRASGVAVIAASCVVLGAAPVAALATTGTNTDKRTIATISKKGVTFKPKLTTMKLTTGVTLRVHVVNELSGRHWFKFGTHRTKILRHGQAYTFYYTLDTPGNYVWKVELGHLSGKKGFHGTYVLPLPKHFH
jgi:hypothetical protein